MEWLFTPWRMAYVTSADSVPGCVLCRACEGASELVVHTGELNFVVMNLFPYSSGHVMVAPKRHLASLAEATPEETELPAVTLQLRTTVPLVPGVKAMLSVPLPTMMLPLVMVQA